MSSVVKVHKNHSLNLNDVGQLTGLDKFNQLVGNFEHYNDINKHISEVKDKYQQDLEYMKRLNAEILFNKDKTHEDIANGLKLENNSLKKHLINRFEDYLLAYNQGNAAMNLVNVHQKEKNYLQQKNNQLVNDNDILRKRASNKFDEYLDLYENGQRQLELVNSHQKQINKLVEQNTKLPSKATVDKLSKKIQELESQLKTANEQASFKSDNDVELISKLETRISNFELIRLNLQRMLEKSNKERRSANFDKEKELLQELTSLKVQNQAYIDREQDMLSKHKSLVKNLHEKIESFEAQQRDLTSKLYQSNTEKIKINKELATEKLERKNISTDAEQNKQQLKTNTSMIRNLTNKYEKQNKALLQISIYDQLLRDENQTLRTKLQESIAEVNNFKELIDVTLMNYNQETKYSFDLMDKLESTNILMNTLLSRKSPNAMTSQDTISYIKGLQNIVKEQQSTIEQYENLSGISKNPSDFREMYPKRSLPMSEVYTDSRAITLENSRIRINNEALELHQQLKDLEKKATKWIKEDYNNRHNQEMAIDNIKNELRAKNEQILTLDLASKWPAVVQEFYTLIKNKPPEEWFFYTSNDVSPELAHLQLLMYKEYVNKRFTKDELDVIAVQLITTDPIEVLNNIQDSEYLRPFVKKTAEIKRLYNDRYTELIKLGETVIRTIPPILGAAFRAHYELNENVIPHILMMLK